MATERVARNEWLEVFRCSRLPDHTGWHQQGNDGRRWITDEAELRRTRERFNRGPR